MTNIKVIAPASRFINLKKNHLCQLERAFLQQKFYFNYDKYLFEKYLFLCGNDVQRITALHNAFSDSNTDVIMALRGGSGSARLLDKIDYKLIQKHPKPFVGFSDITALQNVLWAKAKLPSWSGFVACYAFQKLNTTLKRNLILALQSKTLSYSIKTLIRGKVDGILLGGNLTVFASLLGTPYFPNMKDKILVLEDVNEPPYRIDRLLNSLRLAGVFHQIKGVVLGNLSAGLTTADKKAIDVLIQEYFGTAPYPVGLLNSYSHVKGTAILPIGGRVCLDTDQRKLTIEPIHYKKGEKNEKNNKKFR